MKMPNLEKLMEGKTFEVDKLIEEQCAAFFEYVDKLPPLPEGKYYSTGMPEYTKTESGWEISMPVVIKDLYEE